MSLFGKYIFEREGTEIIEKSCGFITYQISGTECYIKDIFVEPEFRKTNIATEMADEVSKIAHSRKCTYLTGTVCPAGKGSTESLKVLLAYGMKLHSVNGNLIIFKKDII